MSFRKKAQWCLLFIFILFVLALVPIVKISNKQPSGELIAIEEVHIQLQAIQKILEGRNTETASDSKASTDEAFTEMVTGEESSKMVTEDRNSTENLRNLLIEMTDWENESLTYGNFCQIQERWGRFVSEAMAGFSNDWKNAYSGDSVLLKEHWYSYFDGLVSELGLEEQLQTKELLILGDSTNVRDVEGKPLEENQIFTKEGVFVQELSLPEAAVFRKGSFIVYGESIIGWRELPEAPAEIRNAWLIADEEEKVSIFYKNHEVFISKQSDIKSSKKKTEIEQSVPVELKLPEQVADFTFEEGRLTTIKPKQKRISGKLLRVSGEEIEIEGAGIFSLDDEVQYYRLYDRMENVGRGELRLGYSFADYVIEDGKIQAGLLVKDDKMENIRVLIKTSDFAGYYHEELDIYSDVECEVISGDKSWTLPSGEKLDLTTESAYFENNRLYVKPKALTGKLYITNVERNQSGQGYRGSFEVEKREDGLLLINEVLLEEYLYAVVPSEMPSSYPPEALKAQAVCARTYAYDKMERSSLSSYGAHVDDSAGFQVYNNIKENVNTTKAVKETRGQLLYVAEDLAQAYYYSTSCGFGTTDAIWNKAGLVSYPYLQAKEMRLAGEGKYTYEDLQREEAFADFIQNVEEEHFEAGESWYRWNYTVENIENLWDTIKTRQEKEPSHVLFRKKGGSFEEGPLPDNADITGVQVQSRGAGGIIEELVVQTVQGEVLVQKEINVRSVLADGTSVVNLRGGSQYACRTLLPSAFFYIESEQKDGKLIAYTLYGGGFGHGVGMSQNGAKNMAARGSNCEEILGFYYTGSHLEKIYE